MWSYLSCLKPTEHFYSSLGTSSHNFIERNVNNIFQRVTCKGGEEVENSHKVAVELDKLLFALSSRHLNPSRLDFQASQPGSQVHNLHLVTKPITATWLKTENHDEDSKIANITFRSIDPRKVHQMRVQQKRGDLQNERKPVCPLSTQISRVQKAPKQNSRHHLWQSPPDGGGMGESSRS